MHRRLSAVLAAVTLALGTAAATASAGDLGAPMTVCLTLSSALPLKGPQETAILAEVIAIWEPHGVVVRQGWEDGACNRATVVKSDLEARPEDVSPATALAWVPFVKRTAHCWGLNCSRPWGIVRPLAVPFTATKECHGQSATHDSSKFGR